MSITGETYDVGDFIQAAGVLGQWKKRLHPDVAKVVDTLTLAAKRYLTLVKAGRARWLARPGRCSAARSPSVTIPSI